MLPFARTFYGQPSVFLWEHETGEVHHIQQGEGGEQKDPLMPLLFCLAQHPALVAANERLEAGEHLTLTTCTPRVRILISSAKPTVPWERNSRDTRTFPSTMGRPKCGTAVVLSPQTVQHSRGLHVRWMNATLPHEQQGIRVLGTPAGHPDFTRHFLGKKSDAHSRLFERIPSVGDLQAAWLLLLYCADAKPNFLLRTVSPAFTAAYAAQHDFQMRRCLSRVLGISAHTVPESAKVLASLPLWKGGLGLRNMSRVGCAAHWSSWADCLPMVQKRHPHICRWMLEFPPDMSRCPSCMQSGV